MALFSERYGYTKASDVIIRERITLEIENAICSCFDKLEEIYRLAGFNGPNYELIGLEEYLWTHYFNERLSNFNFYEYRSTDYIEDPSKQWFQKLDLIETCIKYMHYRDSFYRFDSSKRFAQLLNSEFERLNFAYRIVGNEIVEITSEQEIKAIENAIDKSPSNIKMHLNSALEKYAQRPTGDYRNSIKESISAVEAFCREKTGENTLGKALKKLEGKGNANGAADTLGSLPKFLRVPIVGFLKWNTWHKVHIMDSSITSNNTIKSYWIYDGNLTKHKHNMNLFQKKYHMLNLIFLHLTA